MTSQEFTEEQNWIHRLILHSRDIPNTGLFHGTLGIGLVLFDYAKCYKCKPIRLFSELLIEEALNYLNEKIPLEMASGLCGIGWGIEYLLQNGYMKGDSLDICEVIDKKIITENPFFIEDLSLDTGLEGKLHYILAHIQGTKGTGMPFPSDYLYMLNNKLRGLLEQKILVTESMRHLITIFMKIVESEQWKYEFNLSDFVNSPIKPSRELLDLQNGVAGYVVVNYLKK